MNKSMRKEANEAYQKINQQWLKFHYHVLLLCVAISAVFEIIMYFIIRFTGVMHDTNWEYWFKYIITPITIGVLLAILAYSTIKQTRLKMNAKFYIVSFLMMFVATSLSFVHSGYESILFAFLLPILMTIMYENQRLTAWITVCTIPLEIFTALSMYWDPYKDITHDYLVNLLILIVLTIVTWMISYYMIRFSLMKKIVVINRDVERQQLKEKILIDELTNVGTKNALYQCLNSLILTKEVFHLVMIDVDDFKKINDLYGHLFGDEVLRVLGMALNTMRLQCRSYRYGGDEFCVIIHDINQQYVRRDIENLQTTFTETIKQCKRHVLTPLTMSAGIAKYHEGMETNDIIKCADDALYESKKRSKNRITYTA